MEIVYFLLLIGPLIFVHELGHFLFAKLFDVKVFKFSLGFGPRLLGFRRGETEYVISAFPLGGYVKMLGEDPSEPVGPEDAGRALHEQPLWKRFLIVGAGPLTNLCFPVLLYVIFFASRPSLPPARVGAVIPGMPAATAGLQPGDRVTGISIAGEDVMRPVRYWEQMQEIIEKHPDHELKFRIERDGQTYDRILRPWSTERAQPALGNEVRIGRIGVRGDRPAAQVGIIDTESPAGRAGLRTWDLITSVNGQPVSTWVDLSRALARHRGQTLHLTVLRPEPSAMRAVELPLQEPLAISIPFGSGVHSGIESAELYVGRVDPDSPAGKAGLQPGDKLATLDGRPVTSWAQLLMELERRKTEPIELGWIRPGPRSVSTVAALGGPAAEPPPAGFQHAKIAQEKRSFVDDFKQTHEQLVFGAQSHLQFLEYDPVPIEGQLGFAVSQSIKKTYALTSATVLGFVQLFRRRISADTIGGPIMLYKTAHVAARKGWAYFVEFMAFISINLGLLNLLPVPLLDGGHLMFFAIEGVRRRSLSLQARHAASFVGLAMLLSLMAFACINDVRRYELIGSVASFFRRLL
jgi:regulator of sigma E protease